MAVLLAPIRVPGYQSSQKKPEYFLGDALSFSLPGAKVGEPVDRSYHKTTPKDVAGRHGDEVPEEPLYVEVGQTAGYLSCRRYNLGLLL